MKIRLLTAAVLLAALQFSTVASAQSPAPKRRTAAAPVREAWANLSADEQAKLRAAREAAIHDANVEAARARMDAARQQYHDSFRDALVKADPSVKPILEKFPKRNRQDRHR